MKIVKTSFSGNKANRVKEIAEVIKERKYSRIVEVFGGSCVISNNLLKEKIVDEAIANDYDDYFSGFESYIEFKKELIPGLIEKGFEKSKEKTLSKEQQKALHELLENKEQNLLKYLAKNFVFSSKRAAGNIEIKDFIYFMNDITVEKDIEYIKYLKNVKLDSLDCMHFMEKYLVKNDSETLVIVDPPYLNSAQKQYTEDFFGLEKTIKLLNTLKEFKNDFIFFNQVEGDTLELLKLYDFDFEYKVKRTTMSSNSKREDFMAYIKFSGK